MKIPEFKIYDENNPEISEKIQKTLPLMNWNNLSYEEKKNALQQLKNHGYLEHEDLVGTIISLNHRYLRELHGKKLHYESSSPVPNYQAAAVTDFCQIFLYKQSDIVLVMLSIFAKKLINNHYMAIAKESKNNNERGKCVNLAYKEFDKFKDCLNHIFEQLSINQELTRGGFVPRQERKILDQVYIPTIEILSDPKWKPVNDDLQDMFQDYREGKYQETITKAHSVLQRFLKILLNVDSNNSKGELGKLFQQAKKENIIPENIFVRGIFSTIQSFVSSERATKSTAKPALQEPTSADALLMMNVTMVCLQYCLKRVE